jgi:hypothetical protein
VSITYTYTIASVDEASRCMEIVYTSDGYTEHRIGARLPFVGESLAAVINMYAPIGLWQEQIREVIVPAVGTSGEIGPDTPAEVFASGETAEQIQARFNQEMWQQAAFEKQVAQALVKFKVLATDPTEIAVTTL